MKALIFPFAALLLLLGCGESPAPKVAEQAPSAGPPLPRGEVMGEVTVGAESYAAYVPVSGEALPVLLLFDSHGRGKLVVEKYKGLADREKLILAVSNSSRNGMEPAACVAIGKRMMADVLARTPGNPSVVWAGGFSGGARVAAAFALQERAVNGVIGIGASYDPGSVRGQDLDFFGIVGLQDFNFREMVMVDQQREVAGLQGFLMLTGGGHAWPAEDDMARAIRWQWLESLRDGNIPQDGILAFDPLAEFQKWNDAFPQSNALSQVERMHYCVSAYHKLADTGPLEEKMNAAAKSPGYLAGSKDRQAAIKAEEETIRRLQPGVGTLSVREWALEINALQSGTAPKTELGNAHQRVLNYLSLLFYMQGSGALQKNDQEAATHFLELYAMVDPSNSEHGYLKGKLAMRQGNAAGALGHLEQAVSLGFSDPDRLMQDTDFAPLREQPAFQEMLKRMPAPSL